ncbi:hypothetical protein ACTHQ7_07500 [Microbacterium enclense]
MWDAYTALGQEAKRYTMWSYIVPGRAFERGEAIDVLHRVLDEIDAFRLVFDASRATIRFRDEAVVRVVTARCTVGVQLDANALREEAMTNLLPLLRVRPFGLDEVPIRIGIVCAEDTVLQIWYSLSHLPFDGGALRALQRLLQDAFSKGVYAPTLLSTVDILRQESSLEMAEKSRLRIQGWIRHARAMRGGRGLMSMAPGSFSVTVLRSASAAAAAQQIARRSGVSTTSVVLAALSLVVREYFMPDLESFLFVCDNRADRRLRDFIGQTIGNGLVILPTYDPEDWSGYLKGVYASTIRAYRGARYDNFRWREEMTRLSKTGDAGDLSYYFNDVRIDRRSWERLEVDPATNPQTDSIIEKVDTLAMGDATLFANLDGNGQRMELQVTCDDSVIPPDAAVEALQAVAQVLHDKAR